MSVDKNEKKDIAIDMLSRKCLRFMHALGEEWLANDDYGSEVWWNAAKAAKSEFYEAVDEFMLLIDDDDRDALISAAAREAYQRAVFKIAYLQSGESNDNSALAEHMKERYASACKSDLFEIEFDRFIVTRERLDEDVEMVLASMCYMSLM